MNEINKTLFIPLYGKAFVSKQNIILKDPDAERIWMEEGFVLHGKAKSKWLAKYATLHILMDVYTEFGAKASKYKNPVNDVGVTKLYGVDDIEGLITDLKIRFKKEHSFTPENLVNELQGFDKKIFKLLFTGRIYRKIYRLYELGM